MSWSEGTGRVLLSRSFEIGRGLEETMEEAEDEETQMG